ncbi:hypothetical protein [Herbaspirillum rhizosphaerae]|uniref:hypothetical protein n=1 Tax=Herbaspirillum rhizosphaerae TaxID=346179 RepID=UPI00067D4ED3|nr:hypothetical protein [Herbaspirillum rhizosphaerae]
MGSTLISFLPMFIMQLIYAVFVAQIAARTNKNVPVYVVVTLIPFVGMFFLIYVLWSTILSLLDSVNQLKQSLIGKIET